MKRLISIFICFIIAFSFAACNDDANKPVATKAEYEVTFEFNKEKSTNARVCVNTSLPIGTLLDVDIFVGDDFHSTETVEVEADISGNFFITETQRYPDGDTIKDGRYILSFKLAEMSAQPKSVLEKIGNKGELMTGLDVYADESGNGKIIKFTRPIEKIDGSFTMDDGIDE